MSISVVVSVGGVASLIIVIVQVLTWRIDATKKSFEYVAYILKKINFFKINDANKECQKAWRPPKAASFSLFVYICYFKIKRETRSPINFFFFK